MTDTNIIDTLVQIARLAGQRARRIQLSGQLGIEDKGGVFGTHFLTKADTDAEDIILERLSDAFPGTPTISEEKPETNPTIPPNAFLADPIDGTPCFIHGCDEWGVMISKLDKGVPVAAVIYIPGRELLGYAVRGQGCYLNGRRVRLGAWPASLRDKTMIGLELGPWWTKDRLPETVLIPILEKFSVRSLLSAAYGTLSLLRGEIHAWINLDVGWPWDFAPGWLFMREAGGWVSGPDGNDLKFDRLEHMDVVYAANQELAEVILPMTRAWRDAVRSTTQG